ncbi:hypothetical protein Psch_03247 [Pelotomaculum schinkii]|uniref:Uncharacterized protein n=1 Tax=Pelotomaculum schinkii TaxID=78350 RepID=A0A4Y7RBW0_9FIRM|nr:hypothetical protein Psch_03247 [Pelotomaculum schinkii]
MENTKVEMRPLSYTNYEQILVDSPSSIVYDKGTFKE